MRQTLPILSGFMHRQDAELRKNFRRVAFCSMLLIMVLPAVSYSQINTGGILGRVTDPSGALVANAKVTLANLGTGVKVEGSVTPTGDYAFRGLAPGMYRLTVTAPGFTTFEETNIPVTVATTANRDVQLTLGATTTAVTVPIIVLLFLLMISLDLRRVSRTGSSLNSCFCLLYFIFNIPPL